MENAITKIEWLQAPSISKQQNAELVQAIEKAVESGELNPLNAYMQLTSIEKVCEAAKEKIKSFSLDEAQKYGAKSFDHMGAKVEISELGTKYDFSGCGDVIWEMLNQQAEAAKNALKDRETFLKTVKAEMEIVNPDGGEIYKIVPPIKRSTTGLKITIK